MKELANINIEDYNYDLPEERIAQFPTKERDKSQLLIYNKGVISKEIFCNIHKYLPKNSILVFNNTRVIRARLLFQKDTGAKIEILCLNPLSPADYETAFGSGGPVEWKCLIGNLKKWKSGFINSCFKHKGIHYNLSAEKISSEGDAWRIRFRWDPSGVSFAEVLESLGHIPLPPYVKREDVRDDYIRYQTVYSKKNGSVAAPTAGLHFTKEVLDKIHTKGIKSTKVTLHVGAGTFQPIKTRDISRHKMHCEHFFVTKENIKTLLNVRERIIAVGTTSVRTLESLYWLGVKIYFNPDVIYSEPVIGQWEWMDMKNEISFEESATALLNSMKRSNKRFISASTNIMIVPGYRFRVISGMITNFHQPKSTLLLLISAWVGNDWKKIYRYAIENGFRFLSYGDASLLI
ncbi:MAG: S-adenosylmethionine:tRNA ribosyltransferase-isomerase [Bacteroidia bacterium]|nr:S-adenosylmethionine:tRNA ribosyltransferase-isomerase [Bacteroidia bacterium]